MCTLVTAESRLNPSMLLRNKIAHVITSRLPLAFEAGTFNTTFKDIVFMISEKPTDDSFKGIFMYDGRNKDESRVLVAKAGKIYTAEGLFASLSAKENRVLACELSKNICAAIKQKLKGRFPVAVLLTNMKGAILGGWGDISHWEKNV